MHTHMVLNADRSHNYFTNSLIRTASFYSTFKVAGSALPPKSLILFKTKQKKSLISSAQTLVHRVIKILFSWHVSWKSQVLLNWTTSRYCSPRDFVCL